MIFKTSMLISFIGLGLAFIWGGFEALFLVLTLSILEIGLSFDNAILNAATLKQMNKLWQDRFLYWGILIAVFIVRLWLPVFMVALQSDQSMIAILMLALKEPQIYAEHINNTKPSLFSFGGIFLWLIFLDFLFHPSTKERWLKKLENQTARLGEGFPCTLILGSIILGLRYYTAPTLEKTSVLYAGLIALSVFVGLKKLSHSIKGNRLGFSNHQMARFFYLEILDASFSLDGVITAFVITQDLLIIFIGLSIGAVFVRSITIHLLKQAVLTQYRYLEHGAHYALGILAAVLLLDSYLHIPGWITGILSISVIAYSFYASRTPP
ncbi:MAG: DUF475 domain-containing protein [Gammaproteobacteria bacterium]|nr:DUF475 domain-containing protein [Gammaproteobacteria bacterium]